MNLKTQREADSSNRSRDAEKQAVVNAAADEVDSLEHFVRNILLPRHLKEMASLTERLQREMEAAKKEAHAKVAESARLNYALQPVLTYCKLETG